MLTRLSGLCLVCMLFALLSIGSGCGNRKMSDRVAALDDSTLLDLLHQYPEDSEPARLIRDETKRRGLSPPSPDQDAPIDARDYLTGRDTVDPSPAEESRSLVATVQQPLAERSPVSLPPPGAGESWDLAKAWWDDAAPSGLPVASSVGTFTKLPEREAAWCDSLETARRIDRMLADDCFWYESKGVRRNMWKIVALLEGKYSSESIPRALLGSQFDIDPTYLRNTYGPPTFEGGFEYSSGRKAAVHWYGPVCLFIGEGGSVVEIGGWPNRVAGGNRRPPGLFPPFDWDLAAGDNIVELINTTDVGVTIGLRTKDAVQSPMGVDAHVRATRSGQFNLPAGQYDVFLVYDDSPGQVRRGEPFELKTKADFARGKKEITKITLTVVQVQH